MSKPLQSAEYSQLKVTGNLGTHRAYSEEQNQNRIRAISYLSELQERCIRNDIELKGFGEDEAEGNAIESHNAGQ